MSGLRVHHVGPGVTVQDGGRRGFLAQGVSRGGAADQLALAEGAALLGQPIGNALEMAGMGGRFEAPSAIRISLTGAPMQATLDGAPVAWHASHLLPAGAVLDIKGVTAGVYGYLTVGGGFDLPTVLGGQGAHLAAGLGRAVQAGDHLPLGADTGTGAGMALKVAPRWEGGTLRVLPSLQTEVFSAEQRNRFEHSVLTRDTRGNRMGVRLLPEGEGFGLTLGGTILSEVITPGDIQIPGDGAPYILLAECQTTGGYPRIGTVIPADLPRVAQSPAGAALRFQFVSLKEALAAEQAHRKHIADLKRACFARVRDPRDIADLLSYTLISGVTKGEDLP